MGDFEVVVGAGTFRSTEGVHPWTPEGVAVDAVAEIPRAVRSGAVVRRNT